MNDQIVDELELLRSSGEQAAADLFLRHRDKLNRMVTFRLDHRLLGRVDADDVMQEAFMEASRRVQDYIDRPTVPFFIWLRQITMQVLIDTHRRHLGAQMRDANQEIFLHRHGSRSNTSLSLAAQLIGNLTSPSGAAMREEALEELRTALEEMDDMDREVLVLRHLEELSNNEVAQVLGLEKSAASKRYIRALKRLRSAMEFDS